MDADKHQGLPPVNDSVKEFEIVLNKLLGWETTCWPWIDLMVFYLGSHVFKIKNQLAYEFEIARPIRHTHTGERITVYRAGGHTVRLHHREFTFDDAAGVQQSYWIGWIKLPDNPPANLQAQIKQLIQDCGCKINWTMVEFGIDILPEDITEFTSTLRLDSDRLVSVAWESEKAGVPQALVSIQDTIERTLHLNYSGVGVWKKRGTTSYRRTRDKQKRLKNYPAPKHVRKKDRAFHRVELTLEKQALRHCLETGGGGLKFPLDVTDLDFRDFFKLLVPRDLDRLAKSVHRRQAQGQDPSKYDDLEKLIIRNYLALCQEKAPHAKFRDEIHGFLDGRNVAYRFDQVFPLEK